MNNTPDRETIRQALAEATPGPWELRGKIIRQANAREDGARIVICEMPDDTENAHLIANAPEWLRSLLDQLENREEAIAHLMKEKDTILSVSGKREKEIARLKYQLDAKDAEIAELKSERDEYRDVADRFAADVRLAHEQWITLQTQLAERDATIAKQAEEMERLKVALHTRDSYDKSVSELHEENERLRDDHKAMRSTLNRIVGLINAEAFRTAERAADECLLNLKEPSHGQPYMARGGLPGAAELFRQNVQGKEEKDGERPKPSNNL